MPVSCLLRILLALCTVAVLPPSRAWAACDGTPVTSGPRAIDVDGARRSFIIRMPSGYAGTTAAPVVFAFHPFGMNAQYMQGRVPVQRTWPEAIAIYPDGMRDSASPVPSWQTTAPPEQGNRDVQFFDAMLAWLDNEACIDRARVFVLGYSNGAQFSNLLACERSGAIAGVASAAGRLPCRPAAPVPVVISHGLQDRTIAYAQGVEASEAWATQNACAAPPRAGAPGCFSGTGCGAAETVLCTYAGGHEYDLPFTRIALEFFKAVP